MESHFLPDTPLEDPTDDRLGFTTLARSLAEAVSNPATDDCMIFALYGDWGSGKSTCVNFVLHFLEKKPREQKPFVVRFNPWWFSGRGELLEHFFREFSAALGKEPKFRKVVQVLGELLEVASVIPEPTGSLRLWGRTAGHYLQRMAGRKEAWLVRKEIRDNLLRQDHRILVVIDDVDRLSAEEMRSLFRVIKAVADFPKTSYLLAFDRKVVVKALDNLQGLPGEAYLEKIVQVPFDLSLPDRSALRRLFLERLNTVLGDTPSDLFDRNNWGNVFWDGIDHFLKTMRSVKRLVNALSTTYPSVRGEVNGVDFVAVDTIRVFHPRIYQLIWKNPDMFTGQSEPRTSGTMEEIKAFHDKWLEETSEEDREAVKKLLTGLFPKVEAVFGGTSYTGEYKSIWRKQCRVCSPEVFPVYFRFAVPQGDISRAELQTILALGENPKAFGDKLVQLCTQHRPDGSTRVSAFLERMGDSVEIDTPKEHIPTILAALYDVGDELLVPEDEGRGLASLDNDVRIGWVTSQLLKRYETPEERFRLLREVFSRGRALSMIVRQVNGFLSHYERQGGATAPEDEYIVKEEHLPELKKVALGRIKQAAEEDRLLESPRLASILYRWSEWENPRSPRKWVSKVIASDEGLADLLKGFLSRIYSHTIGDRVKRVEHHVNPKDLEPFADVDSLAARCKTLLEESPSWLRDDRKLAVEKLLGDWDPRSRQGNSENMRA